MKRLCLAFVPACLAAGQVWAQAVETPEGLLGNLTPIMEAIQSERGYALDYEHKGSLSLETWRNAAATRWSGRSRTSRSRFHWI